MQNTDGNTEKFFEHEPDIDSSSPTAKKAGRPKGSKDSQPRIIKKTVKEAIKEIFDTMLEDNKLMEWALDNPTEFMKIAAKLIPHEIEAKVETTKQVFKIGDKVIEF